MQQYLSFYSALLIYFHSFFLIVYILKNSFVSYVLDCLDRENLYNGHKNDINFCKL